MLKKIRAVTAGIVFILCTLLFLDFTGLAAGWFGFLAKIQFLPALLALNVGGSRSQCWDCHRIDSIDIGLRKALLLDHMPVGDFSGCRRKVFQYLA